jgi:ATP-dependent protease Clp ATPase subunit
MRCSFCRKSQDVVGRLISSPSDYPRAYICNECIEVCNYILEDDRQGAPPGDPEPHGRPVWHHMLPPEFFDALDQWIILEIEGCDASPALAEMKRIAARMKAPDS